MSEQQQQQAPERKRSLQDLTTIFLRYSLQLFRARHDRKAFGQVVENLGFAAVEPASISGAKG